MHANHAADAPAGIPIGFDDFPKAMPTLWVSGCGRRGRADRTECAGAEGRTLVPTCSSPGRGAGATVRLANRNAKRGALAAWRTPALRPG